MIFKAIDDYHNGVLYYGDIFTHRTSITLLHVHIVKVGFFLFHLLRSGSESDQRLLRNLRFKLSDIGKPGPERKSIQRGDVTRMVEDEMSWVKRWGGHWV